MPCSCVDGYHCFRGAYCQQRQGNLNSTLFRVSPICLHCTLKMEAAGSSEMLVTTQKTAWCYIPKHCNLNFHCLENFRSHISVSAIHVQIASRTDTCIFPWTGFYRRRWLANVISLMPISKFTVRFLFAIKKLLKFRVLIVFCFFCICISTLQFKFYKMFEMLK
jgi:hypothetical protein